MLRIDASIYKAMIEMNEGSNQKLILIKKRTDDWYVKTISIFKMICKKKGW